MYKVPSTSNVDSQKINGHDKKQQKKQFPLIYELVEYKGQNLIDKMAFMLIRPPRFRYNPFFLDPSKKAQKFIHQSHKIKLNNLKQQGSSNINDPNMNQKNLSMQISLYLPRQYSNKPKQIQYLILYLHGNSSSRLEVFLYLNMLPQKVGMASFDFLGCGNRKSMDQSNENLLTLGKNQSKQVDIAAKYLKSIGYTKIVGWGRSMGAVSLLLSQQLQILIVDSPYSSLQKLCSQSQQKVVPCYLKCLMPCLYQSIFNKVNSRVYQLSGLKIQQMNILQKINKNCENRQICFVHGQNDIFIDYQHSEALYQEFGGRKQFILFQGTHNSNRSQELIDACVEFIKESFDQIEIREINKKSKLLFVRENNQRKRSERKQQMGLLNSLKKKKIRLPKLDKKIKDQKSKNIKKYQLNNQNQLDIKSNHLNGQNQKKNQQPSSTPLSVCQNKRYIANNDSNKKILIQHNFDNTNISDQNQNDQKMREIMVDIYNESQRQLPSQQEVLRQQALKCEFIKFKQKVNDREPVIINSQEVQNKKDQVEQLYSINDNRG